MATVAASYAGGAFALDDTRLIWSEQFFDYNHQYGLAVQLSQADGSTIKQALRLKMHRNNITDEMKTKMKSMLLKWLEENVYD